MCFLLDPSSRDPKIATEDIIVFKTGFRSKSGKYKNIFESRHLDYKYIKGFTEEGVPLCIRVRNNKRIIDKGYHSYIAKEDCLRAEYPITNELKIGIFKIPKGSQYYENFQDRERVSDQIVFVRFENFRERIFRKIKHATLNI